MRSLYNAARKIICFDRKICLIVYLFILIDGILGHIFYFCEYYCLCLRPCLVAPRISGYNCPPPTQSVVFCQSPVIQDLWSSFHHIFKTCRTRPSYFSHVGDYFSCAFLTPLSSLSILLLVKAFTFVSRLKLIQFRYLPYSKDYMLKFTLKIHSYKGTCNFIFSPH